MNPHSKSIRSIRSIIAVLVVATTACGSTDKAGPAPTSVAPSNSAIVANEPGATEPSADEVMVTELTVPEVIVTEVTATEPESTDSIDDEPEIIGSVTADTLTTPGEGSSVEQVTQQLRDGVPTVKGTTYSILDPTSNTGFSFVSPVDGAYPFLVVGAAALSLDEAGLEGLMTVIALDRVRTFIQPIVDVVQIPGDEFPKLTEPTAADFLGWFTGMPGVTVGAIEETTVDGWPARMMTYAFGPTPTGLPCDATSSAGCVAATWNPGGSVSVYAAGDVGTLYEVLVDGDRALIDVTRRPGAQEMFESVRFLLEDES